jgi:mannose-1-phosphate guanylyltransferase
MTDKNGLMVPVILCGGTGTRLWPLSRSSWPKQFLQLLGPRSLFQQTLVRVGDRTAFAPPVVVTNEDYRFMVTEQAEAVGVDLAAVLLEPVARNTGAAIAAGTSYAMQNFGAGEDQLVLALPADHQLRDDDTYRRCLAVGGEVAREGGLVTFGVSPTEPATGFGYIQAGEKLCDGAYKVARFVEKPPRADAEAMVAAGGYFWNSGMFLFSAGTFLAEGRKHAPAIIDAAIAAVSGARADLEFVRLDARAFSASPNISVDYAIFERTDHAVVVPADIAWSDLGSWDAVWKAAEKDEAGNVLRGRAAALNTTASLIVGDGDRLHVTVDGLDDVAVVASADAVLVGRLSASQHVGSVVKQLAANPDTAHLTIRHPTDFRPWGGYTSVMTGDRFQVKRLFVKPGKRLSLQKHHHRSEHWVVVRGTAEVTIGDELRTVAENEAVYIPAGTVHRLANPGRILLEVIEVQTGSYLGEDDIIRIEDEFGRS